MLLPLAGRSARRRHRTGRSRRTSTRFSPIEVGAMLSESVANEKDSAAGACGAGRLPACVRDRGKTAIELAELGAGGCSESLGKGNECPVELGTQAKLRRNAAKVQDRGADRQRRH